MECTEILSPETPQEVVELPKQEFAELSKKYTSLWEDYSSMNRSLARQRDLCVKTGKKVDTFSNEAKEVISYIYHELKFVKRLNLLLMCCVVVEAVLILRMWSN